MLRHIIFQKNDKSWDAIYVENFLSQLSSGLVKAVNMTTVPEEIKVGLIQDFYLYPERDNIFEIVPRVN